MRLLLIQASENNGSPPSRGSASTHPAGSREHCHAEWQAPSQLAALDRTKARADPEPTHLGMGVVGNEPSLGASSNPLQAGVF